MKTSKFLSITLTVLVGVIVLSSFFMGPGSPVTTYKFPYKRAGLTERQAAAHLLNRFTYGATPGQVDSVVNMGLEKWFAQQMDASLTDDTLNNRLKQYDAINLSNADALKKYPQGFVITNMAIKDSVISKDSVGKAVNKKAFDDTIKAYMVRKGIKADYELTKQFIDQNILRAVYSRNQLQEVLTDFWFNHFNVSFTKGESASFIPAYERDVIRPNVLNKFDKLLLASAKSPAMLYFLDNFTSVGPPPPPQPASPKKVNKPVQNPANDMIMNGADGMTASAAKAPAKPAPTNNGDMMMGADAMAATAKPAPAKPAQTPAADMMQMAMAPQTPAAIAKKPLPNPQNKNVNGLNENYAREVMELHTMGVDGGYTQTDVTQAARVLTGWTIYPISSYGYGSAMKGLVDKVGINNLEAKGYVHEGDFLYTPNRHDMGEKVVLGHHFDGKGGYQEGVDLLEMLAHHPSTAKFICTKLAVRFVSDKPPISLINKMAKTFTDQDGDIKQVLITMVTSPEFWSSKALREKTKSPFELVVSSVRGLNADVKDPYQLYNWMTRMGQKIYYYQAPTGFPDRSQYWINTGSLLNRMNFGLALAQQRIPGVKVNLAALNQHHEPESADAALITYSKLVMPERNLDKTYKQLAPLLNDPALADKVNTAATKAPTPTPTAPDHPTIGATGDMMTMSPGQENVAKPIVKDPPKVTAQANNQTNNMLSQVVGIIIGSPEFQRR
ncbi:uncharacterized protein DUF1800 [Mucilaginibacter gracilis]|uniref:Uncharacterized protein DUF1800 n=1 Tax=Mucilaginibacter gracilis TaxID=423350 RepID=A0A495J2V1_9SPHI|nr:DUF1800 domain-containing protein [Mucilaginibacter gracilis]RKR83001.1 uncharacterized protein DUF1800 [Mucilaginibacter gracilis]